MWAPQILLFCVLVTIFSLPLRGEAAPSQIDDGNQLTVITDKTVTGTATLIADANANRAALNCTNTSSSVNVRWGSSSVTAAIGQRIPFGAAVEIRSKAAVYMISEGANVTVACTEEVR